MTAGWVLCPFFNLEDHHFAVYLRPSFRFLLQAPPTLNCPFLLVDPFLLSSFACFCQLLNSPDRVLRIVSSLHSFQYPSAHFLLFSFPSFVWILFFLSIFSLLNLFCLSLKSYFSSLRVLFTASVHLNIDFPFLNQTTHGTFPYI